VGTDFAAIARLLANPARSAALNALLNGRPLAAGELARVAGVRPPTISEHLAALVDGGLVTAVRAGRHRYCALAGAEVAGALEAFSRICPATPVRTRRLDAPSRSQVTVPATPVRTRRQSVSDRQLRHARLCYDHLAGALGVAILDRLCAAGWLVGAPATGPDQDFQLTGPGAAALTGLGLDLAACRRSRRHFARPCLDCSERRAHLAGALGAGLTAALLDGGWVRRPGTGRAAHVTERGEQGLRRVFGISVAGLAGAGPP
jgi:DNA-binding transcriptional ArsR family regulator